MQKDAEQSKARKNENNAKSIAILKVNKPTWHDETM